MNYAEAKNAIKKKRFTTAVIGLGYVGLPLILIMAKAGLKVVGLDIDKKRIKQINSGKSPVIDIKDDELHQILKKFKATSNWKEIKKADVIIIAVPTPLTKNKTPDTSAIESAGKQIAKFMKKGALVILESTSYPGTTEELLKPILEKSGFKAGKDFHLAFAPERIDPGNKQFALIDIPKVVGGVNKESTELATAFYLTFLKKIHKVSTPRVAEMSKIYENIFRLVNISLVNELKMIADKMEIDFWEVIEAAKTKPYGFMPFYPGPGVGGHCIPLDPFYLSWKAREYNFFTRFIDLAGEINELMPHHVVTKIIWTLNLYKKSVRDSKILILGVAYKKDVADHRESAAIPIIWDLSRKGAEIVYNDPFIPEIEIDGKMLNSKPLDKNLIKSADCVVILTNHSTYDYPMIAKEAKLLIDTRGVIKEKSPKIFN